MITGIIVFAHGSRVEPANEAVRAVARELVRATGCSQTTAAFLELAQPDLVAAADRLAAAGVERVVVIPYFLTPGLHMERDLPRLVSDIVEKHKGLRVEVAAPLDGHPGLIGILAERFRSLEAD
ncbi:MAG: CbiX/SirB N-terminal domain-containing protein [Acidobacteria bacterium]|nr:CbiX/SirB N-terminal domain-containing protein [Acidobacteriota bacterium]